MCFKKIEIDRLGDEEDCAVFFCPPATLLITIGRYHDDRQIRPALLDLAQQREAVHAGHIDIGEHDDELRLDAPRQLI